MTRIVRAELLRLVRRRTLVVMAVGSVLFSAVAALAVFSSAGTSTGGGPRAGATLAALADHGGGTEAFAIGASRVGSFVFVVFIALIAGELSGGTFRALLLRDPHRLRLIVGKLVGALLVAAAATAAAEVLTFLLSVAVAPSKGIATSGWFSLGGAASAVGDYATVMGGIAGWAVFGTALAVVFRSVPLALGVGFAWAGPFENIVSASWSTGYRIFPGQVLASLIQGGTSQLALAPAVVTAAVYVGIAGALSLLLLSRRDVTA